MDTGKLRNQYDELVDPTQPLPVDTVEAQIRTSVSETLTYNGKAAAGAVTINSTAQKAIVSIEGDQVSSYWGLDKNKVYECKVDREAKTGEPRLMSVTETNGSAAVVINDADKNLELLFESLTTTVKRYVIKVTDTDGHTLYGWIFGVAASGNVYTFDVVNNRVTETRNWVGTLADFTHTSLAKVEIFRYNSSLTFGTGTTLTEEVICPREYSKSWNAALKYASENLTNGQYFVDYMRGRIIGKKADNTASETITYNVSASTSTINTGDVEIGAVELKDGATDTRAIINAANTARAATTQVVVVQSIDETGKIVAGGVPKYENDTYSMAQVSAPVPNLGTSDKWLQSVSTAYEESRVVSAAACVLKSIYVEIDPTAATDIYYLQIFNLAAEPADATAVTFAVPVAINHTNGAPSARSISFDLGGVPMSTGCVVVLSTTALTKTETGDIALFHVSYTA